MEQLFPRRIQKNWVQTQNTFEREASLFIGNARAHNPLRFSGLKDSGKGENIFQNSLKKGPDFSSKKIRRRHSVTKRLSEHIHKHNDAVNRSGFCAVYRNSGG